jgi:hypothetical protein
VAVIAAVLFALHPLLIRQAAAASDLALITTLLVAFAYFFVIRKTTKATLIAGLILGLSVITRFMTLPLVPFAMGVMLAERRFRTTLVFATIVLAMVLPTALRNYSISGSWWPTRSGMSLYIGNSTYTAAVLPDHDLDILQEQAEALVAVELSDDFSKSADIARKADEVLTKAAIDHMTDRPLLTVRQKILNILYFFSPRLVPFHVAGMETRAVARDGQVIVENPKPRPMIEVLSYSAFFTPVLLAAILGIYLRRHALSRDAILWCIVATFVAIHAIYFPATRYRAPMEFVLLFYAAVAIFFIFELATHTTGQDDRPNTLQVPARS